MGKICGLKFSYGGEEAELIRDRCGLNGANVGTLTVAKGTSLYLTIQYDCELWWGSCEVDVQIDYFDEKGSRYARRLYRITVPSEGAPWVRIPDAIFTPTENGSMRISAYENRTDLQDWVTLNVRVERPEDIGIEPGEVPKPPVEPEPEPTPPVTPPPPDSPEPPLSDQPSVPWEVEVSAVLKISPIVRKIFISIYDKDKKEKLEDGRLVKPGDKVSAKVRPGTELKIYVAPKPGLLSKVVEGEAKEGEEESVYGTTWEVEIRNLG